MGSSSENKAFNPFSGLKHYNTDDSKSFSGHEDEVKLITAKLLNNNYLVVLGAAGTGKSSLVLCGVISKIRNFPVTESASWKIAAMRPGTEPFHNIVNALNNEYFDKSSDPTRLISEIDATGTNFPDILNSVKNKNEKLLIVVDQLEDLFRYFDSKGSDKTAKEFINFITDTIAKKDPDIYFIIILRSEYMGQASHFWELTRIINSSNFVVPEPDHEIWNKSISDHAEEIFNALSDNDKKICSAVFKALTKKNPQGKGIRNPINYESLKLIAGCSHQELSEILSKFEEAFYIIRINSLVDLSNECLILNWERLKNWIDEEALSRQMYLQLSEASALYQQGKRGLYKQPGLQDAINWREKVNPGLYWGIQYDPAFERTMVYLKTSENEYLEEEWKKTMLQKKAHKKSVMVTAFSLIIIAAAITLAILGFVKKHKAEEVAFIAENEKTIAEKMKIEADSSARIAIAQKIQADSTTQIAMKMAKEAEILKLKAEEKTITARNLAGEALQQKNRAVEEKERTLRLRMLSVGRAMSLKSLQLSAQKDLQALLAFQAYLFNRTNRGNENDADIYSGLYNVALQNGKVNYKSYKGQSGEIKSIVFIPGKNQFFTSGTDGKVLKWALDKPDQALQVMYSGNDVTEVLAVSPDASWLACGSSNSSIRMIPLKGNNMSFELSGHSGKVTSLIYSYDGKYLYSAAVDGKVLKWDIEARTNVNVNTGSVEICSLDISSNGNFLAGISTDGKVIVWTPGNNSGNFNIETSGKKINVIRFNPDKNLLAIGDDEGKIEIWDVDKRKMIAEVQAHDAKITDIRFNTKLNQMATAGNDKKIKIYEGGDQWDLSEPPIIFNDLNDFVLVMRFSEDGQLLVSGGSGNDNLLGMFTNVEYLAGQIRSMVTRNLTSDEWKIYVGKDIPLENTIQDMNIKVEPRISVNKK